MLEVVPARDRRTGEHRVTLPENVVAAMFWWSRAWNAEELDAFASGSKQHHDRFKMRTTLRPGERPLLVAMRIRGRTFGFPPVERTRDGRYVFRLPPDTFLAFFRATGHDESEIYDDDVRLRLTHRRHL